MVLEDHYIHTSRENKALDTDIFWPIHTSKQATDIFKYNKIKKPLSKILN